MIRALVHKGFDLESGWYNGHCHRGDDGNWFRESYPIPVISVKGICDIELPFDAITASAKLKKDAALAYPFETLTSPDCSLWLPARNICGTISLKNKWQEVQIWNIVWQNTLMTFLS